jgi:hypothetical protein
VDVRYLIEIPLASADLACCIPSHDDWLNDRSSTPPVSMTIQPLRLAAAALLDALLDDEPDGPDVLLPQAAASSASAPKAAMAGTVRLTKTS